MKLETGPPEYARTRWHAHVVLTVSPRLIRRIRTDFGADAELVIDVLGDIELVLMDIENPAAVERVLAGVVLLARGDLGLLGDAAHLAYVDWRDVLVGAGLGHDDCPARLDAELGSAGQAWTGTADRLPDEAGS